MFLKLYITHHEMKDLRRNSFFPPQCVRCCCCCCSIAPRSPSQGPGWRRLGRRHCCGTTAAPRDRRVEGNDRAGQAGCRDRQEESEGFRAEVSRKQQPGPKNTSCQNNIGGVRNPNPSTLEPQPQLIQGSAMLSILEVCADAWSSGACAWACATVGVGVGLCRGIIKVWARGAHPIFVV